MRQQDLEQSAASPWRRGSSSATPMRPFVEAWNASPIPIFLLTLRIAAASLRRFKMSGAPTSDPGWGLPEQAKERACGRPI
jgi:hypothetical protein